MRDIERAELYAKIDAWLDSTEECTGRTIEALLNSLGYEIVSYAIIGAENKFRENGL